MNKYSKVFVYLRFSSDAQTDGHSMTRQRESAREYLRSQSISEALVEWVEDPAVSAFHGEHVRVGALGKLLSRVRDKTISDGLLIFESVDRASRQGSMPLFAMLHEVLEAGFRIYFLDQPEQEPFDKDSPPPFFFAFLSVKAEVARWESQRKSYLSQKNWAKRLKLAREEKQPMTHECPRWLHVVDGRYEAIHDRVASIVEIFQLARDGWGISKIMRYANMRALPVPGKGATWHTSLLQRLFCNRALIGEYQPFSIVKGKRTPIGEPILDYYPTVVDTDLFHAVRNIRDKAASFPNRRGENNFNYLIGLGRCECGGTWRRLNKNSGAQKGYAQYSCAKRQRGVTNCANMPSKTFDMYFIGGACERIPELLKIAGDTSESKRLSIQSQIVDVERKLIRLFDLYESSESLRDEIVPRLNQAKAEKLRLKEEEITLDRAKPPNIDFDFGDAISVYLPAFLDVHDESSEEARLAFQARAMFQSRLIQAVEYVEVALNRDSMKIVLKNGVEFEQIIEKSEFGTSTDFDEDGVEEIMLSDRLTSAKKIMPNLS